MTNHSTEIMNQATLDFIRQHQDDDVRQLAFLGSKYPEVDMPFALDQIRGRKMARVKLPRWASIDGIIYPLIFRWSNVRQSKRHFIRLNSLPDCSVCLLHHPKTEKKRRRRAKTPQIFIFLKFANLPQGAVDSEFAKMKLLAKATDINRIRREC